MSYRVVMMTQEGETITDVLPAQSEAQLMNLVKARNCYTLSYEKIETQYARKGKLKLKSVSMFAYQLSAMLSSGISVLTALKMVQNKARNAKERKVFLSLYELIQTGNSLSSAMIAQEGAFDDLMISMVQSGESSGALADALQTMSKQYDRELRLKNKLRAAMTYPIILLVLAVAIVLLLVVFVLPTITANFQEGDMPATTRALLAVANFLINRWYIALLVVVGAGGLLFYALHNKSTRIRIDYHLLHFPLAGKLLRIVYSARCARSFASLYRHGVPALDMIELTSHIMGNAYLEQSFDKVYVEVSRGEDISSAIAQIPEFDPLFSSMLAVGEETGTIDEVLVRTADYFDEESQSAITTLISYVEPIMLIAMGFMIGFIVIAIMQPIFQMYNTVQ